MHSADVLFGLLLPFAGTALGAACVFFMRQGPGQGLRRRLSGFAGGVMTAASVWSLLIPAMEQADRLGGWAFLPATIGFWLGTLFLLLPDSVIPRRLMTVEKTDGRKHPLSATAMMVLAVTLHNIPEGLAVGVVYAGLLSGTADISAGSAFALALGVAIQNFPEGAIVSIPLHAEGRPKRRAFIDGTLSGAVEPLAALPAVFAAGLIAPVMPYLLGFAAGAMMYVVVAELIPEMSAGEPSTGGVLLFAFSFTLMMALDVALG